MSRTYKDKKWELRFPTEQWEFGKERIEYRHEYFSKYLNKFMVYTDVWYKPIKGAKPKIRKREHVSHCWRQSTPSRWTRLMMNRPQRRAGRVWEAKVIREVDLEVFDYPGVGRKPHVYYW